MRGKPFQVIAAIWICGTIPFAFYAKYTDDFGLQLLAIGLMIGPVAIGYAIGKPSMKKERSDIIAMVRKNLNQAKSGFGDTPEGRQVAEQSYEIYKKARQAGQQPDVAQIIDLARPFLPPEAFEEPDDVYWADAGMSNVQTGRTFRIWAKERYPDDRLPEPSSAQIERVAARFDQEYAKKQGFRRTPGTAVVRSRRADGDVSTEGNSWLGGLPTLGDTPWPVGPSERPMHHLAQIDLSELDPKHAPRGLPKSGSLTFFAESDDDCRVSGKVLYLQGSDDRQTPVPDNLPSLFCDDYCAAYVKGHTRENASGTFPRWAVHLTPLPLKGKRTDPAKTMQKLYPNAVDTYLSTFEYREALPQYTHPFIWDTAQRVANTLSNAKDQIDKTIDRARASADRRGVVSVEAEYMIENKDAFRRFVDETVAWAFAHDPLQNMSKDNIDDLTARFDKVNYLGSQKQRGLHLFYKNIYGNFRRLDDAVAETLLCLAHGKQKDYESLPPQIRADIDDKYLLPSTGQWHQMFGDTEIINGAEEDHVHDYVLLKLHADHMMNWMWGDVGVIRFWISPQALKAQDWDKVEVTLDGH